MQPLFLLLVQPLFELVFYAIGYATAWLLVPVFTFGHVVVQPSPNGRKLKPRGGRIQRIEPGKYLMTAEMGSLLGVLFWVVVVVGYFWIRPE